MATTKYLRLLILTILDERKSCRSKPVTRRARSKINVMKKLCEFRSMLTVLRLFQNIGKLGEKPRMAITLTEISVDMV